MFIEEISLEENITVLMAFHVISVSLCYIILDLISQLHFPRENRQLPIARWSCVRHVMTSMFSQETFSRWFQLRRVIDLIHHFVTLAKNPKTTYF